MHSPRPQLATVIIWPHLSDYFGVIILNFSKVIVVDMTSLKQSRNFSLVIEISLPAS